MCFLGVLCVAATGKCMNMYLDNLYKLIKYQGHRSKVKVRWVSCVFVCMILRLHADSKQDLTILFCNGNVVLSTLLIVLFVISCAFLHCTIGVWHLFYLRNVHVAHGYEPNHGSRPPSAQSRSELSLVTRSGPMTMEATRGNGYAPVRGMPAMVMMLVLTH